jgi:VCBS repeat-containing protein
MGTITGSNGNDTLLGTIGSDIINSGNGDDIVNGGAGSDQINGGAGNDTLIYTVSENQGGFKDVYTGGSGIDTVRLQLSSAEWNDSAVRAELERYVKFLSTVKMNPQGEVSNGSASDFVFNFGTSTLTVQMMEKLAVWVKPEFGGDYAQVDYLKSLITGDIAGTAVEAGGVGNADKGVSIVSGQLKSDDLDGADNLFRSVDTGIEAKYGTYTISANGLWHYTLNNADSRVQELKANEVLKDTFSVSSADGAVKVITITIVGSNDAPVVSGALSDSAEEGGAAFAMNLLTGASDADHGETAGLDATALNYSVDGVPASGIPAGLSLTGSMLSVDPTDRAFDHLAVGEHTTIVVSYNVKDVQGATVAQHATITISGTNDVPVVTGALTFGEDESEESYSLNLLAGASDVDHGETASLSVADVTYSIDGNAPSGSAPSGVALAGNNLKVDPSDSAFNHLAVGEKTTIVVSYNVKDVHGAAVAQVATITIHGTNDTPVVSTALSSTAAEGTGGYTMNLLDGASDADDGETASLSISNVGYSVDGGAVSSTAPDGVSLAGSTLSVNPANGAFNHLAVGTHATIVVTYNVKDAQGATVAQSATIMIEGTNDAPVVTGAVTGSASEDGDVVALNALANASDVDDGTTFTVVSMPAALPAGVNYDAATHTFTLNPGDSAYQSLAAGQKAEVAINYGVSDGTVTVPALVKFTVTGTNDAPVVTGAVMDSAIEGGAEVTINALANASDVDQGTILSVVDVPDSLPAGVSYDSESHSFTLDPSDAAYQSLAHGQAMDVTISYGVTDGKATVPASVTFTVTGTNDAPVVTGAVMDSATEDGVAVTINALANASDVDQGTTLSVVEVPDPLPAGVSYDVDSHSFTLDPSDAAYQSLAHGQAMDVTISYGVTDGRTTVPASVTFTVTGTNDVPVVTGTVMDVATEDGAVVMINALANASDVDQGTTLSVVAVPDSLPAGVSYDPTTHTFALNPGDSAYQSLAAGQTAEVTVNYGVSDGTATVPASVKFTVIGSNDAPVVSAAVNSSKLEGEQSFTMNLLAGASDVDNNETASLAVVDVTYSVDSGLTSSSAPAGVSLTGNTLNVNPANTTFDHLAVGESSIIVVNYSVKDIHGATVAQSATITITGTNDAPVVAAALTSSAAEGAGSYSMSLLAGASDVDHNETATLSVTDVTYRLDNSAASASAPAGISLVGSTLTVDPSNSAFNHLAVGAHATVTVSYNVKDAYGAVAPQSATIVINGTNDTPMVSGTLSSTAAEGAATYTMNLLAGASDADDGETATLSVANVSYSVDGVAMPGTPAGVSLTGGTLSVDPANGSFDHLAAGESSTIVVSYSVKDAQGASAAQNATITITGTNDAPVLNLAATPVLVNVVEDAGAPSGAVGTLVSSLVNLNPPLGGLDNVTDADSNALTGIALTGTNATNGTWWYSTNGGDNWQTVGAVSNSTALLLSADANTRVYFQGNLDFNGTVSDGLTFRAWDQSSGTAGTKVSTTTNGGSSAFSSAADTAAITVIGDNFAPVPTNDRIIVSSGTNVTISTSALLGNDIDIDGSALTITGVSTASGISNLSLSGNTISFKSGSAAGTSVGSFQYTVSDGRGGTATGMVAIDVKAVTSNSSGDTVDLSGAGNYQASYIDADNGPDTVTGGAPGDSFYGGSGNSADTLRGGAGNDLLVGEAGNDILSGSSGNDILRGGSGDDAMDGGDGSEDMLDMSDGTALINFTLVQSAGITTTGGAGGLGNDSYQNMEGVIGSSSNDSINGSNGNDIIRGGAGNDTLDGRVGNDLLDFSDGTAGIVFTMGLNGSGAFSAGGLGTDTYTSFEGVIGTAFADTLNGLSAADELRGGAGNDTINGQAGDDRIVGGAGSDTLTGGADNDTFVFDSAPNAVDSITDFNASGSLASGDMVELSLAVFAGITTAPGSVLSSSEFASSVGGGVNDVVAAGARVIYDSVTGNLYYDADGQGSGGRTLVAKLVLTDPGDTFDYNDIKIGS